MDAVTYPDSLVSSTLEQHFVTLKINMLAKHADFREACMGQKVIWAPGMLFADSKGRELRRYIGWLPPESFVAELQFVQATQAFQSTQFEAARDGFAQLIDSFPTSEVLAEAKYWHGIAGFLAAGMDFDHLGKAWRQLVTDHPGTRWATHASVIEDAK